MVSEDNTLFYDGMRARTELTCLHHNHNVGRQQAHTAAGPPCYKLVFPKAQGEWVVRKRVQENWWYGNPYCAAAWCSWCEDILVRGGTVECISDYNPQSLRTLQQRKLQRKKTPLQNTRLVCKGCSNITSLLCKSLLQDNIFIMSFVSCLVFLIFLGPASLFTFSPTNFIFSLVLDLRRHALALSNGRGSYFRHNFFKFSFIVWSAESA